MPQLRSLCDDLHHKSKSLGMYRISEGCTEILIRSTKTGKDDRVGVDGRDAGDLQIDGTLTSLEASVASARAALDSFYAAD